MLFFNKIKNPVVYTFIIHSLYASSIFFIGLHKHQEEFIRETAVLSTILGLALYLYFIKSGKTLSKAILTPLPYLIFYTIYLIPSTG